MSTRQFNLGNLTTFQFNVTAASTPEKLTAKIRATSIAFNENTVNRDTITDSASGFLVAGFAIGDQITVSGSASNDGTYTIDAVVAGTITIKSNEDLTAETAGETVKIVAPKSVPEGILVNIKAKKANSGDITVGHSSAAALNSGSGFVRLDANESIGLQVVYTDVIWLDTTVTGEGVEVWFEKN